MLYIVPNKHELSNNNGKFDLLEIKNKSWVF
jgi:hypothetical protein